MIYATIIECNVEWLSDASYAFLSINGERYGYSTNKISSGNHNSQRSFRIVDNMIRNQACLLICSEHIVGQDGHKHAP